jgi:signal transduction histidine kinase
VELDKLVARAVDMFQGVAEYHGIKLQVSQLSPVAVPGNAHHLRQVLNNLLDNAIKFTTARYQVASQPDGGPSTGEGRIEIRLTHDASQHQARLEVQDNGIGIAAADVPHVFDRFFRADRARTRQRAAGGTGLGLSICQAIIAAHRGKISVQSKLGEGTTFIVVLPMNNRAIWPDHPTAAV